MADDSFVRKVRSNLPQALGAETQYLEAFASGIAELGKGWEASQLFPNFSASPPAKLGKCWEFLDITECCARTMTGKPYKSKLAPFEHQIVELRRRRPAASYREIQLFLADQHGVRASINTIFTFLKIRRRWDRKRCGDDSQKSNSTAAAAALTHAFFLSW